MITKLKIEWPPQLDGWQVLASRRLKDDPNAEAGWWIGVMNNELMFGWGRPFGRTQTKLPLSKYQSEYLYIDDAPGSFGIASREDLSNLVGLMGDIPEGDELHLGFDPQQPWAKWQGSIEVVEVIED